MSHKSFFEFCEIEFSRVFLFQLQKKHRNDNSVSRIFSSSPTQQFEILNSVV